MKKERKTTLRNQITSLSLHMILLQSVILMITIASTGTLEKLDENAQSIFRSTTLERAERLEEHMKSWSSLELYYQEISDTIASDAREAGVSVSARMADAEARSQVLARCMDTLITCQDVRETSSVFMILESGTQEKDAIFLTDVSPREHVSDCRDLLSQAGLPGDMIAHQIALDSIWRARLTVLDADEYYYKPFRAGSDFVRIDGRYLGCFTGINKLFSGGSKFIAYSMPLLDEQHRAIGVFGVGISLEHLKSLFPETAIGMDEGGTTFIAKTSDAETFTNILACGGELEDRLPPGSEFRTELTHDGLHHLGGYDLCYDSFDLYRSNTPFLNEQWVAGCFVHHDTIHSASARLLSALMIAVLIALALSIPFAIVISTVVTKPLGRVIKSMETLSSASYMDIPRTGLKEIDALTGEIVERSRALYESGTRLSTIIELSAAPIGVVEYHENAPGRFVTKKLLSMLGLGELEGWANNYIAREKFDEIMLKKQSELVPLEDEDQVFALNVDGEQRYFRVLRNGDTRDGIIIFIDISDVIADKRRIRYERDHDLLTGMYNRTAFDREVGRLFAEGRIRTAVMSVWDMDNLKFANDNYGHEVGDNYLRALSDTFRELLPAGNSIVARRSGDEFFAFVYNEDPELMHWQLSRAHRAFSERKLALPSGGSMMMGVSAGMADFDGEMTLAQLEQYADFAMYNVKRSTKGEIALFEREVFERDQILINGVGELTRILEEEDVTYQFQPIVDPVKQEIFGYEALMTPNSDMVRTTAEFIRLAKSQSKLGQIERLTWMHGIRSYFDTYGAEACCRPLFLKTLPNQCLSEAEFSALEAEFGDKLRCIVPEFIENARINEEMERRKREWCSRWGASVALDNYGSGYSNIDILTSKPFDYVKISIGLIKNIDKSSAARESVRSIIQFCHSNNQKVIAEGVEHPSEMETLRRLGVDYVQGYLLAKPDDAPAE